MVKQINSSLEFVCDHSGLEEECQDWWLIMTPTLSARIHFASFEEFYINPVSLLYEQIPSISSFPSIRLFSPLILTKLVARPSTKNPWKRLYPFWRCYLQVPWTHIPRSTLNSPRALETRKPVQLRRAADSGTSNHKATFGYIVPGQHKVVFWLTNTLIAIQFSKTPAFVQAVDSELHSPSRIQVVAHVRISAKEKYRWRLIGIC